MRNIKKLDKGLLTVIGIFIMSVAGMILAFMVNGDFFFFTIIGLGLLGGMSINDNAGK